MRGTTLWLMIAGCLFWACGGSAPSTEPAAVSSGSHPTVSWILACRAGLGGFGCFPGDSAFTSRTGMALEALADLGALEQLTGKDSLIAWLKARQDADGGFFEKADYYGRGRTLPWGTLSALEPTYWAVRGLKLLGAGPERPEAAARFIAARQKEKGAFEATEYAGQAVPVALYTTFWAVAALKTLGLPVPDSSALTGWIRGQQETLDKRGGFALSPDAFFYSTVEATYFGVAALNLLGAEPEHPRAVKQFLLSSFGQEADGGFELGHGDNWNNYDHYSQMQTTYAAVAALEISGLPLTDTDTSRAARPHSDCVAWIDSVQNPDGGFGRLGVNVQTPVPSPSEMRATWQAVRTLTLLGAPVPRPRQPKPPREEIVLPAFKHRHPAINFDDPVEVWAYRRIALPYYTYAFQRTGSRIAAVGMLARWVRAAVGPENQASDRMTEGRRILMHGWGQCGTMSILLQDLAASLDHAARGAYCFGDANAEVLIQEDNWEKPHWVCYIPFTNEYVDPGLPTPAGTRDGWSALDLVLDYGQRVRGLNYISKTKLGDFRYWRVWLEQLDNTAGAWGNDFKIDTTSTYGDSLTTRLYPGESW